MRAKLGGRTLRRPAVVTDGPMPSGGQRFGQSTEGRAIRPLRVGCEAMPTTATPNELPRQLRWLQPLITRVSRTRASVHTKLLVGFLSGALLLVAMAILSVT